MPKLPIRYFRPESIFGQKATKALRSVMQALQGNFTEEPQRTHVWNNTKIRERYLFHCFQALSTLSEADNTALSRYVLGIPIFHVPIFGGWKNYEVLGPVSDSVAWYLGWHSADAFGVSRVPVKGPVRALRGPKSCRFFGFNAELEQIPLFQIGQGTIGQGGPFCQLPLL